MNFHYLDMGQYKRKNHFDYFRNLAYPYVGVSVNVDITDFMVAVKKEKYPFFLSFCYCIANAANDVAEFRQRVIGDEIVEYDVCKTSHTVSLEDGTYCYCTLDCNQPFHEYLPYAIQTQEDAKEAKHTEDSADEQEGLIFLSTLPWISFTSLINPVPTPADSNPRITWGKYFEQDSKVFIPVSVLCNHALVDGLHISQFYQSLNAWMMKGVETINA